MSILHDEGQLAIANEARRVLEALVLPENLLPLLEAQGQFDATFWGTVKEQGWTGITIPEEHEACFLLPEINVEEVVDLAPHHAVACGQRPSIKSPRKRFCYVVVSCCGTLAWSPTLGLKRET